MSAQRFLRWLQERAAARGVVPDPVALARLLEYHHVGLVRVGFR